MKKNKKENHENFWQITFPFLLGSLVILGLAIWTVGAAIGEQDISPPANTSAVILLLLFMSLSLFPLAIIGLAAYGIIKFNKILPEYMRKGQTITSQIEEKVEHFANKAASPIFRVESFWSTFRILFRRTKKERNQ